MLDGLIFDPQPLDLLPAFQQLVVYFLRNRASQAILDCSLALAAKFIEYRCACTDTMIALQRAGAKHTVEAETYTHDSQVLRKLFTMLIKRRSLRLTNDKPSKTDLVAFKQLVADLLRNRTSQILLDCSIAVAFTYVAREEFIALMRAGANPAFTRILDEEFLAIILKGTKYVQIEPV
jgi:hypothetical protein